MHVRTQRTSDDDDTTCRDRHALYDIKIIRTAVLLYLPVVPVVCVVCDSNHQSFLHRVASK